MKQITTYILMLATGLVLASCVGSEEDLFDQDAVERLEASAATMQKRLTANGGTWAIELYPSNSYCFEKYEQQDGYETLTATNTLDGVGFLVLAQFNNDGTVRVGMNNCLSNKLSSEDDYNTYSGGDYFQSTTKYIENTSIWEVLTDMGPVLSFSSYNDCLHTFSTPENQSVTLKGQKDFRYEGSLGTGLGGDYEFVVVDLEQNAKTAMLKGKKRRTYNRMTLLPEGTDFNDYIKDVETFKTNLFPKNAKNDLVLIIGGDTYRVRGIAGYMPNIFPYDGNAILQESNHSYLITKRDGKYYLRFRSAVGREGHQEQEFCYDEEARLFRGVTNSANVLLPMTNDYIVDHFIESFTENTISWTYDSKKSGETFSSLIKAAGSAISKQTGASFSGLTIGPSKDKGCVSITVTATEGRNSTITAVYTFDYTRQGSNITLAYKDCNGSGRDYLDIPDVKALIDAVAGEFTLTLEGDGFAVKSVRITRVGAEADYAVLTHN